LKAFQLFELIGTHAAALFAPKEVKSAELLKALIY